MNNEFTKEEGTALWRQTMAAARPVPATQPVSALDLAAWLDGRAGDQLAARIEAALASDSALLDTALAASAAAVEITDAASERLAVRARALVEPQIKPVAKSGGWLSVSRWRRQAEWAMVGLCLMVAAATGLWIGSDVGTTVLESQSASISLFDDDGGGLLALNEDL